MRSLEYCDRIVELNCRIIDYDDKLLAAVYNPSQPNLIYVKTSDCNKHPK